MSPSGFRIYRDDNYSDTEGSLFPYIAEPVALAASAGIPTIEINPEPTAVSHLVDYRLRGDAAQILPRIVETARSREG